MGLGVFRIESQGLPISGRRLIEFSRPAQHDAQIVVALGEIGKDFQHPPQRMGGLPETALVPQRDTQISVRLGIFRLHGRGFAQQLDSTPVVAHLGVGDACEIQGVGMLGLGGENALVKPQGLAHASGLLVADSLAQSPVVAHRISGSAIGPCGPWAQCGGNSLWAE
jgi:hypothetical protein